MGERGRDREEKPQSERERIPFIFFYLYLEGNVIGSGVNKLSCTKLSPVRRWQYRAHDTQLQQIE